MAGKRAGRIWAVTKILTGTLLVAVEAALIFLLSSPVVGGVLAAVAVFLGVVVFPMALTALLMRGLKKAESGTTLWRNVPGMVVICAALASATLLFGARGAVSATLLEVPDRYPGAGGALGGLCTTIGGWLAPSPEAKPEARGDAGPSRDAGTAARAGDAGRPAGGRDAGRARRDAGTSGVAAASDAGVRDAAAPADASVEPSAPAPTLAGSIQVCERVRSVWPADLGHEPTDELVVACDSDVRVLWLRPDGSVLERTRFRLQAPEGLELSLREPRVVDLDGDDQKDLLLCAYWTTERGGTRGGDTWWAAGLEDGQFSAPKRLVGGYCAAVDVGDVDGDGAVELLVALVGNPWQENRPNGELRWYERVGRTKRWAPRGRTPLHRSPATMWLADANGDAFLDVVVRHGWELDDIVVCPGSAQGPLAIDESIRAPTAPDRTRVSARLDGDDHPDEVRVHGGSVELHTTAPLDPPPRALTKALDFQELAP